jgi:hypothetical protein
MAQANVRLRLEAQDGSQIEEYRILDGRVEVRNLYLYLCGPDDSPDSNWRRVTQQQLRIHVERDTVVAEWLKRRLGWRPLLQACVSTETYAWKTTEDYVERDAA